MSTLRHPVGPQPKKVYWRRRLLVLLILAAIIAVVVLIVVRPGSGAAETGGAPAPTASSAPTSADQAPDAAATPGSVDTGADAGAVASGDVVACAGGNIQVTPVTDADTYDSAAKPQLSFTITNTGAEPCSINAGTSQQIYTITSGSETYWVSTDCQTDPSDTQAVLQPGVAVSSTPFTWDRTRSSADTCSAPDRPLVPGAGASYHLDVSVAGIPSSDSKQFILN
jgi:hypothetical protein